MSEKAKADYFRSHVYSKAPEAKAKLAIDLQIMRNDYGNGHLVSLSNESYLRELIAVASAKKHTAGPYKTFQFFIIRGGAEGFLDSSMLALDAGHVELPGETTGGVTGKFTFDLNDLLIVFDDLGKLVSAALLERPIFITNIWSTRLAEAVYDSWANRPVFIRKNTGFEIPYLGLGVDDGFRSRAKGPVTVDIHKHEDTNGCIMIVDPRQPFTADGDFDRSKVGAFEPQLILDVLARKKIDPATIRRKHVPLGIMRTIIIK